MKSPLILLAIPLICGTAAQPVTTSDKEDTYKSSKHHLRGPLQLHDALNNNLLGNLRIEPKEELPTTLKDEMCKNGDKKPYPGECTKLYVCTNGRFVEDECGWLRKFDAVTLECMYSGATCAPLPTASPPTSPPTPQPTEPPTPKPTEPPTPAPTPQPTQAPTSATPAPTTKRCTEGEKLPIQGDCDRYLLCSGGKLTTCECGWFRSFDSITHECTYLQATCA